MEPQVRIRLMQPSHQIVPATELLGMQPAKQKVEAVCRTTSAHVDQTVEPMNTIGKALVGSREWMRREPMRFGVHSPLNSLPQSIIGKTRDSIHVATGNKYSVHKKPTGSPPREYLAPYRVTSAAVKVEEPQATRGRYH